MISFKTREIEVSSRPVIIIGEAPGKQRKQDQNQEVFHGNKSGDFVETAITGKKNIVLTNVINVFPADFKDRTMVKTGLDELKSLIDEYKPGKIICLGKKSLHAAILLKLTEHNDFRYMPHPSWILRFKHKERNTYLQQLRHEL